MLDGEVPTNSPTETAAELLEIFRSQGRWPKMEKSWEEMSQPEQGAENERIDAHDATFNWLTEMLGTEMCYSHHQLNSNHGIIHAFRFWLQYDGPDFDSDPNTFIVFEDSDRNWETANVFMINSDDEDEWVSIPGKQLLAEYHGIAT